MQKFLCSFALGLCAFSLSAFAQDELPTAEPRIYIAVGDPNVKKVLMAIEATTGTPPLVVKEFFETMTNDMDYTDLFEFLPANRMPAGPKPGLEVYRGLGTEFLIRSTISVQGSVVEAEVRLFDASRNLQILGRKYPFVSKSGQIGRELAHFAANDIIQALTGEAGIFRTRILMSCGMNRKEIYIMDFDGQNARPITRDGNFALSPSWNSDGRKILFTSYRPAVAGGPLNPNLYMVDLISNQRRLLSAARGLNTGGVFHPKLEKVAYTFSQNGRPEIYALDLVKNIRAPITTSHFFSVEPNYSPDGTKIAYSSSRTGRPHIYVADADGSSPKQLTRAGVYNSSPNWSPKGDRIVFSGQENMRNNFNIFLIDPSGSNLARLTDFAHSSENPTFSPDGRFIAFSSNQGGRYGIYVMTARGAKIRPLSTFGLGHCKQPSWSPRL